MYLYGLDASRVELAKKIISDRISELNEPMVKQAILFGSCARGDFKVDSDIDVAIFLDYKREYMCSFAENVSDIATEIAMAYFLEVSFICIPYNEYMDKKSWYMFYNNIEKDGVVIYG